MLFTVQIQGKVVTRITTVVKKKVENPGKDKGELMLNNMDALEVRTFILLIIIVGAPALKYKMCMDLLFV